ncbi:hypothetical protein SDC9_12596 [bioreactor metagenome]|uniref:Uncharacterized protein n=2 Tax=root TaxID=1 RepID=A0A644TKM9_9ZZZZ
MNLPRQEGARSYRADIRQVSAAWRVDRREGEPYTPASWNVTEIAMPQNFIRLVMRGLPLIVLTVLLAAQAQAAPLTTKYYSLDLPADWVVVNGPTKVQEAVQVVMGQKEHKSSALIIVGPANSGEAEQAARGNAKRLQGSTPVLRSNGQWEFTFEQKGVKGYGIVREDAQSKLLLMLVISGDARMANFVYSMRGPYRALMPQPPQLP